MSKELKEECNYELEAKNQKIFYDLLSNDQRNYFVPKIVDELSTKEILTMELIPFNKNNISLDKLRNEPLHIRNRVGRRLLRLTLKELFEFQIMQVDPNFSNYMYLKSSDQIGLLDFGATRKFNDEFVDEYLNLVWAASNFDKDQLLESSYKLKLLNGTESNKMIDAHIKSGFIVAEPFQTYNKYDFSKSNINNDLTIHAKTFLTERKVAPPDEIYSLHRKFAGAFNACVRINAKFPCRDLLEYFYYQRKTNVL